MRIYIAGKVTGSPDYLARFSEAEEWLRSEVDEVVNPVRIMAELPETTTYEEYIHTGLEMLRSCEAIYMLQDWEDSKGATLERQYALTLGKAVFYERAENELG